MSPSSLQQHHRRDDGTLLLSFSSLTQKDKVVATNCHCHLHFNTTREEDDLLPLPFSLQQHHRSRRQHIVIIFFFSATPPQKKRTTHCCHHLLLLKHKKNKTHKKTTTKKNQERRGSLPSSSCSTISLLALISALPLLHFRSKCFLLASYSFQAKEKRKKPQRKKIIEKKKCVKKGGSLLTHPWACWWTQMWIQTENSRRVESRGMLPEL